MIGLCTLYITSMSRELHEEQGLEKQHYCYGHACAPGAEEWDAPYERDVAVNVGRRQRYLAACKHEYLWQGCRPINQYQSCRCTRLLSRPFTSVSFNPLEFILLRPRFRNFMRRARLVA